MLRIAVPNKGALSEAARDMLQEADLHRSRQPGLVIMDP